MSESAPTVREIAEAIEASLQLIDGLRTTSYLSDVITPPVVMPAIEEVEFHGSFGGGDVVHTFTVFLILGRASDRAGIEAMEAYMSQSGPLSISAAIEADQTLGGVVSSAAVEKSGPPASINIAGTVYLSVPFIVTVHA